MFYSQQCCPNTISSSGSCFYYSLSIALLSFSFGICRQSSLGTKEIATEEESLPWRNNLWSGSQWPGTLQAPSEPNSLRGRSLYSGRADSMHFWFCIHSWHWVCNKQLCEVIRFHGTCNESTAGLRQTANMGNNYGKVRDHTEGPPESEYSSCFRLESRET